jgi:integrase
MVLLGDEKFREPPMYIKNVKGHLYFYKRKGRKGEGWYCTPLGLRPHEKTKAVQAVGAILADLEKGIEPTSVKTKVKSLVFRGKVSERREGILENHIYPYFGEMKARDIQKDSERFLSEYIESRFGLDVDGELHAKEDTIEKEIQTLQALLQIMFGKAFRLVKPKYNKIIFESLPDLTLEQIEHVSTFVKVKTYFYIFWFMAYTGLDIMDVITLKWGELINGWVDRKRSKTQTQIFLPICEPLMDIIAPLPRNIDPNARIFQGVNNKATSTYFNRIFKRAGLAGYGPKYLRRFIGAQLTDLGYSEEWTGKALGHSPNSKQTRKYCKIYQGTLEEAFSKIKKKEAIIDS